MKYLLIALISLTWLGSAHAHSFRRAHMHSYIPQVVPTQKNIFGTSHSGVAPSTAIPESGRSSYPAANTSHTGGTHD